MNFGITKTIPAGDGQEAVDALYDGSLSEFEFHMAGTPSKLQAGHYVYTIFGDQLIGRLRIKEMIPGAVNPKSGKPRTLIIVAAPGEKLTTSVPKKGHRGTRYTEGEDWPEQEAEAIVFDLSDCTKAEAFGIVRLARNIGSLVVDVDGILAGLRLAGVSDQIEIDLIVRCGNRVGIVEAKTGGSRRQGQTN